MNTVFQPITHNQTVRETESGLHKSASAVSWGAILAGAAGAAALSLILLILGTGLGLSSISPWADSGTSATTMGVSTILWITFTQLCASGMGGYLAGRLRTRWLAVHTDEVYFRDTAHGFLAWAIATLATATLLTSVIGSIIGGGVKAGASLAGGLASATATSGAAMAGPERTSTASNDNDNGNYFIDLLFRKNVAVSTPVFNSSDSLANTSTNIAPTSTEDTAEISRIFMVSMMAGALSPEDSRYVSQVVARRTGLTGEEADTRVKNTYSRWQNNLRDAELAMKQAADSARKASAYAALWLFISLLSGAFIASWTATFGGRQRDA